MMSLPEKLTKTLYIHSLLTVFFLTSGVFCPLIADDASTTLGDLSARIEDLENRMNAGGENTNDANPGTQVSADDIEKIKDELRALRDSQDRHQEDLRTLRQDIKQLKEGKLSSQETFQEPAPASFENDEQTDSLLKLLEESAPGGEENTNFSNDLEKIRETATKHAEETAPKLSAGNAEAQYNEAFALYETKAYKEAERAFSYFIKTYPNDALVTKAMYWKAESCLKQGKQKEAKILFVNTYKKNPKGPKAPNCLLKLGDTLAIQGKKEDACTAWKKLEKDFPHLSHEMKGELTTLKEKYGCQQSKEKKPKSAPKN